MDITYYEERIYIGYSYDIVPFGDLPMHLKHLNEKIVVYPDNEFTRKFVDDCDLIYPGFNMSKYFPDNFNDVQKHMLDVPSFKSSVVIMNNDNELEDYISSSNYGSRDHPIIYAAIHFYEYLFNILKKFLIFY